jgi:hypothetical protein
MKQKIVFPRFDAELNTDTCDAMNNAELTLTVRMGFKQINPSAGADEGTYHDYGDASKPARKIIKWTPATWKAWKDTFCASVQEFWTGKFWLVNDAGSFLYAAKDGQTYVPNVWCRVKVVGQDGTAPDNHHTIEVVRLHPSVKWFGSHSTLYDSKDTDSVEKSRDSKNKKVMQRAHVHEFGHILGLGHVDIGKAHCPASGDTNASACYGVSDTDMNSVMGSGMQLRLEHASPWREAIRAFSVGEVLSAVTSPTDLLIPFGRLLVGGNTLFAVWPAKMKRHYPRTPTEAAAGTLITAPPKRGAK